MTRLAPTLRTIACACLLPLAACGGAAVEDLTASDAAGTGAVPWSTTAGSGNAAPPAAAGTVTLHWQTPTHNDDGSALMDLAGYRILWGSRSDALDRSIVLDDPRASSYVVQNLPAGTYYFALRSRNALGIESETSVIAVTMIS
ncbi:MAG: fibronectin type III domain-containing protein [Steroidobacteraceae bacterium]